MLAVGRFLLGAFVALMQLLLVLAGAFFSVDAALGNGPVGGMLVFVGMYAAVVWWPARDLVEGWLGMIAHRRPDRYEHRAENLGRAVVLLAMSIFLLALPTGGPADRDGHAFLVAYLWLALGVFGFGATIPRLWFVFKGDSWDHSGPIPQLLDETGQRGAVFICCLFLGIGIAFTGAHIAYARRNDTPRYTSGNLCRKKTADCPRRHTVRIDIATPRALVDGGGGGFRDACLITVGDTTTTTLALHTFDVTNGHLDFDVALPDGVEECHYWLQVTPAKAAP